ncbi:type I-E CRISPR-associated endonuclease Cas1e [Shimia sp. R9_3]|uniref:type I-E CRISPR-associated endonuclease Cas1e n=1 Tax=Shimia sp. R9_3 TaxID=2821113 RepID=UPI001ADA2170|nr:type I-E CRISPR-associated endonuclease Cas1e [Shimia sp. R9_3]MBO9401319.1 type I-E CRISPR-associated endonuclease Cas1 [Shimia sp. R9_3]
MVDPLPLARPIPLKERAAMLFVERARIDVKDSAFVAIDAEGTRTVIPVGGLACLMLEPGVRISHAAVGLAAQAGTLITWVGEGGVRLYSAGQPGGARADKLLWQAALALDEQARLRVVRAMFTRRFGEEPPAKRSVDQLRGIEGQRVKHGYELLARKFGLSWKHRRYDPGNWDAADLPNRCLSSATACLHGLSEAAVLAAGYAPAIGFLHRGKPLSFVYDVADLWKLEVVVPIAFRIAAKAQKGQLDMAPERAVRQACRDEFRKSGLLAEIIPTIEEILTAGDLPKPDPAPEGQAPALPEPKAGGDAGHRG